jgi:dihydroorotate dehydrogenase
MFIKIEGKQLPIITNSSGCWAKTPEQIYEIATAINGVISKTCTLSVRETNPLPNFIEFGQLSVNCKGLPNMGYLVYRNLWRKYYDLGITYVMSLDASNLAELVIMLQDYDKFIENAKYQLLDKTKELVEINISCPNKTVTNQDQHCSRLLGYDIKCIEKLLITLETLNLQNITIGLKMPPYIDRYLVNIIGNLLLSYQTTIKYIVCTNSIPNAMVSKLSMGIGGISGLPTKYIALANVIQFGKIFANYSIKIIGCGGIESIDDVALFLNAGAISVQVGRLLYLEGINKLIKLSNDIDENYRNCKSDITIKLKGKL